MNTSMVIMVVLVLLLLASDMVIANAYSATHQNLELEREYHDRF